eukprot:760626-Alexandrium_andersonii.AAC.1
MYSSTRFRIRATNRRWNSNVFTPHRLKLRRAIWKGLQPQEARMATFPQAWNQPSLGPLQLRIWVLEAPRFAPGTSADAQA